MAMKRVEERNKLENNLKRSLLIAMYTAHLRFAYAVELPEHAPDFYSIHSVNFEYFH